jgi:2-C-methyl-D-erythritol 4-phosphate cytidylyltransferase
LNTISAIIVAAGSGSRLNSTTPKQFLLLGKHSILYHSIQKYLKIPAVSEIIVVSAPDLIESAHMRAAIPPDSRIPIRVVAGGKERQDSVYNGLKAVAPDTTIVCVHDAVRPFISADHIQKSIRLCKKYDGAIVAVPTLNTLKECEQGLVSRTIDRSVIWQAQTPQTFRKDILIKAYDHALREKLTGTDDACFVEAIGGSIAIVEGSYWNIKITTSADLQIARAVHKKDIS